MCDACKDVVCCDHARHVRCSTCAEQLRRAEDEKKAQEEADRLAQQRRQQQAAAVPERLDASERAAEASLALAADTLARTNTTTPPERQVASPPPTAASPAASGGAGDDRKQQDVDASAGEAALAALCDTDVASLHRMAASETQLTAMVRQQEVREGNERDDLFVSSQPELQAARMHLRRLLSNLHNASCVIANGIVAANPEKNPFADSAEDIALEIVSHIGGKVLKELPLIGSVVKLLCDARDAIYKHTLMETAVSVSRVFRNRSEVEAALEVLCSRAVIARRAELAQLPQSDKLGLFARLRQKANPTEALGVSPRLQELCASWVRAFVEHVVNAPLKDVACDDAGLELLFRGLAPTDATFAASRAPHNFQVVRTTTNTDGDDETKTATTVFTVSGTRLLPAAAAQGGPDIQRVPSLDPRRN